MEENEFKFEPFYVCFVTLVEAGLIYTIWHAQQSAQNLDLEELAFFTLLPIFFGLMVLPLMFKLLTGVPAIKLTADSLVDNVFGIDIDWSNVQNLYIRAHKNLSWQST